MLKPYFKADVDFIDQYLLQILYGIARLECIPIFYFYIYIKHIAIFWLHSRTILLDTSSTSFFHILSFLVDTSSHCFGPRNNKRYQYKHSFSYNIIYTKYHSNKHKHLGRTYYIVTKHYKTWTASNTIAETKTYRKTN